ncbi:MAG: thioredoxin domain-containing protein, partial [Acidobacteria bacterium]|nr:thioredoxin domain-containing protein [Acidobacteriota bacterium]
AKPKLLAFRAGRVRPGLDDKVLTSWNGLMISALARGYQVLEEPRYLEAARKSARFVLHTLRAPDGGLLRTWRRGSARLDACLDDYVFMAAACLDLYESDFDPVWVTEARALMDRTLENFWDKEDGGFFFTPAGQKDLALRSKTGYDGAIPAGNSVAALVLFRLARLTGEESYADRAIAILRAYREPLEQMPAAFSALLWALDLYLDTVKEVALVGRGAAEATQDFLRLVRQRFVPNRVVAFSSEEAVAEMAKTVPLLAGKVALGGKPTAYLCEHFRCKTPTTDAEMFEKMLLGV